MLQEITAAYHQLLNAEFALLTAHKSALAGRLDTAALTLATEASKKSAALSAQTIAQYATPRHADPSQLPSLANPPTNHPTP